METILIQAAVCTALFIVVLGVAWCQARSAHLRTAQKELDEYHRAAMALINDESVPIEVAEFAQRVGEHLNNPSMARHVVRSIKRGPPSERSDTTGAFHPETGLQGKALENFSKVVVYGTLISASHDLFLAHHWRSVILFALTKPAPVKVRSVQGTKNHSLLGALAEKLAGPPLAVGPVDTRRAPELARAMACA